MTAIIIKTEKYQFEAELFDTPTAKTIIEKLPLKGSASLWGGEIYFSIPVEINIESDAREILNPGELGYWPTGSAFCIFFGPTPVSTDGKPKAASAVNVFGKLTGDLNNLKNIEYAEDIEVHLSVD